MLEKYQRHRAAYGGHEADPTQGIQPLPLLGVAPTLDYWRSRVSDKNINPIQPKTNDEGREKKINPVPGRHPAEQRRYEASEDAGDERARRAK